MVREKRNRLQLLRRVWECQKSACGLPNAEPSTLGTSAVYFANTTLEQFIADMKYEAVEEFAEKIKEYINNKVIADFDDSESVKYYTINLDEFESERGYTMTTVWLSLRIKNIWTRRSKNNETHVRIDFNE